MYDAQNILRIKITNPEKLFTNPDEIKQDFRKFAKLYHPDENKTYDSTAVFQHINALYQSAIQKIKSKTWEDGIAIFDTPEKLYKLKYFSKTNFELGNIYVSNTAVAYTADIKYKNLFQKARDIISSFKFADCYMKDQMYPCLPNVSALIETSDKIVLVLKKDKQSFLLKDILPYITDKDGRHAAWIIGSLLNIRCYLSYCKIDHNGFDLNNIFINPQTHCVSLVGGFWYAEKDNGLKAISSNNLSALPLWAKEKKICNDITDIELIKNCARKITKNSKLPDAFSQWLKLPATKNAFDEYSFWMNHVLKSSYGERKFVELNITKQDIY